MVTFDNGENYSILFEMKITTLTALVDTGLYLVLGLVVVFLFSVIIAV